MAKLSAVVIFNFLRYILSKKDLFLGVEGNSVNWNGQDWAQDCDFPGGDFSSVKSTVSSCINECLAVSECTHYAWSKF